MLQSYWFCKSNACCICAREFNLTQNFNSSRAATTRSIVYTVQIFVRSTRVFSNATALLRYEITRSIEWLSIHSGRLCKFIHFSCQRSAHITITSPLWQRVWCDLSTVGVARLLTWNICLHWNQYTGSRCLHNLFISRSWIWRSCLPVYTGQCDRPINTLNCEVEYIFPKQYETFLESRA